jgi:hypothetical protein
MKPTLDIFLSLKIMCSILWCLDCNYVDLICMFVVYVLVDTLVIISN